MYSVYYGRTIIENEVCNILHYCWNLNNINVLRNSMAHACNLQAYKYEIGHCNRHQIK